MAASGAHKSLEIGAYGWLDDSMDDFYPEDLPPEWRLAYYANAYRCVLVPAEYWLQPVFPDLGQWLEDVHETFSFSLEISAELVAGGRWEAVLDALPQLGGRLGGLFVNMEDVQESARIFAALEKRFPSVAVCAKHSGESGSAPCWQPGWPVGHCASMGMMKVDEDPGPMALRGLLESFIECAKGTRLQLFVQGSGQRLADAVTMARLLGY